MIQLDKCPICGSAAKVDRETHALPRVVCIGCGLSTRHVFEEGLAEVWNDRSPLSDPTPLTLEELRGMIGKPVWTTLHDGSGGAWGIVCKLPFFGVFALIDPDTCYYFEQKALYPPVVYTCKPNDREG